MPCMPQTNTNSKINVEHVVKSFRVGGLESIIKNLVLNSKDPFIHGVTILQRSGPFSQEVVERGCRVTDINAFNRKISVFRLLREVVSSFKSSRPDIIHCHDTESWIYGVIAGKLSGVRKAIFTKHGHMENFSRTMAAECRLVSWFTKYIVAVSPQVKDELVARLGINPAKIEVVFNGIDNKAFHPAENKSQAKEYLGINSESFVAGSVTRFFQIKNIEMQIDMVDRLKDIIPNFQYIIVAPMTPAGEKIKEEVYKRNLQYHVHFLGFRSDIPKVLSAMDVFVLTSFSEGTSVAILEAMASGCVPIASSTGGTPNLIEHDVNGFLFDVHDLDSLCNYVLLCYRSEKLRMRLLSNMNRILQKYSIDNMVNSYENIYLGKLQ